MPELSEPRIVGRQQSVAEIFSTAYRLLLPFFQRGYAWKETHALRLLSDILAVAEGRRPFDWYPLGVIILAQQPGEPEASVADGHQRLMTLTILLALLRDRESDPILKSRLAGCISEPTKNDETGFRLVTHDAARNCLARFAQAPGSTQTPFPVDEDDISESEANIIANRDALAAELTTLTDGNRHTLATFLLDRCLLLVTSVREPNIAQFLFSTMHDSGLKPSNVDLFKAQVLARVRSSARESCQTAWESVEARLGQSSFERVLRHIAELHTRTALPHALTTVLERHFDLQEATAAEAFVERTLRTIGRTFTELIEAPSHPTKLPPAICRRLQYLSWVRNHDTWTVPLLHWLSRSDFAHPQSAAFVQRLEALAWMQMITSVEPPQGHRRYMRLLTEIDEGTVFDRNGALTITREERRKIVTTLQKPNYTNRSYKLFLLLRSNAALEGDGAVTALPEATIEHIYPSNPSSNSRWTTDFRTSAFASKYRNSFGNLTLLTRSEQDRTKNSDFLVKRSILATSAFALSRRLASRQSWTPDDIDASTDELIEIVMKSWNLDLA